MKAVAAGFALARLGRLPVIGVEALLWRVVRGHRPIACLFTSGNPNRYNLRGDHCLYCSTTRETAREESGRAADPAELRPELAYNIGVRLSRVLDLCDAGTRRRLGLSSADLAVQWRASPAPVRTQALGSAIIRLARASGGNPPIVALRYPSQAMPGEQNYAIFRDPIIRAGDLCQALGGPVGTGRIWYSPSDPPP